MPDFVVDVAVRDANALVKVTYPVSPCKSLLRALGDVPCLVNHLNHFVFLTLTGALAPSQTVYSYD